MARGRFITFEGGEGTGKSTQIAHLASFLYEKSIPVVLTREPGGTPGSEEIRRLLVTGRPGRWDATAELLLHAAARRQHLVSTIWPALESGSWVISDRFADSTSAYQGCGHGLPRETVATVYRMIAGDFAPDLTVILDLPVEVGLERAAARDDKENRYEQMDTAFHQRIRDGFLAIAKAEAARCVVVEANRPVHETAAEIRALVEERLVTAAI